MSHLKDVTLKRCFSLLREYVEESQARDQKKGTAILALEHLQKITAGTEVPVITCATRPRADGTP